MSKLVLNGDVSGSVTLDAPSAAGTTILTLPTQSGTVVVTSGAQTIEFADGSASTPSITNSGDTNTGMFFPAADTIAFAEGGVEAMRLDSVGNVVIGANTASYKLETVANNPTRGIISQFYNNASSGQTGAQVTFLQEGVDWWTIGQPAATSAFSFWSSRYNAADGTVRMSITNTGNFSISGSTAQKATGTTWSNPSDQRLKNNIRDYTKGTTELMQVRVREWEYNGKGGTTEGMKGLGVVADEVMTVLPNTVETYDAKLNADDEETTAIKKFDATEITWLLVKTVQEQQTIIETLKADIATKRKGR